MDAFAARPSHSPTLSSAYRLLGLQGMQAAEAGNLVALASGLAPVEGGWHPREIERLLFVRYLVERGRPDSRRCGETPVGDRGSVDDRQERDAC
jgi:hypothetical protein